MCVGSPKLDSRWGKMLSGLMSLIFCCKITILVSKCGVNKMKFRLLWCNGLETFSWHTLSPSVTIECLNNTEYLIIIADHVHLYGHLYDHSVPSSITCFQHHVTKLKLSQNLYLELDCSRNAFTAFKQPLQSPYFSQAEHL